MFFLFLLGKYFYNTNKMIIIICLFVYLGFIAYQSLYVI